MFSHNPEVITSPDTSFADTSTSFADTSASFELPPSFPPSSYVTPGPSSSNRIRKASLETMEFIQRKKITINHLLDCIMSGNEFSTFKGSLLASDRIHLLLSFFDSILEDDKSRYPFKKWLRPHAIELVCEDIHREMEAAKPHLLMTARDVTPKYIEEWDLGSTMDEVAQITPVWTAVLDAASETKADTRKGDKKSRRNRTTVCISSYLMTGTLTNIYLSRGAISLAPKCTIYDPRSRRRYKWAWA